MTDLYANEVQGQIDRGPEWDALQAQCFRDHVSLGRDSVGVEIVELPGPGLGCLWPKHSVALTKADPR